MIRVSLDFEQKVIGEPVSGIPRMLDRDLFVFFIFLLLSSEPIVLNIVDKLEISNSANGCNQEKNQSLCAIDSPNESWEDSSCQHTQNGTIHVNGFSGLLLHLIDTFVWSNEASDNESVHRDSFFGTGWVLGSGYLSMMSPKMFISEMYIQNFEHMDSSKETVEIVLFVEEFMGGSELGSLKSAEKDENAKKVQYWERSELILGEDIHHFEEENPVNNTSQVNNSFELNVIFFEWLYFLFVGVSPVHADELIEKGKNRVNDCNDDERVSFDKEDGQNNQGWQDVIGYRTH
jgi:hypothetical protein